MKILDPVFEKDGLKRHLEIWVTRPTWTSKIQDEKYLRQEKRRLAFLKSNAPTCEDIEVESCAHEPDENDLELVNDLVYNVINN